MKPPNERKLGQIGTITPKQKWNTHEIDIFASSDEAEMGNAGEQPARNSLMNGNDYEQILFKIRSYSNQSLCFKCLNKLSQKMRNRPKLFGRLYPIRV